MFSLPVAWHNSLLPFPLPLCSPLLSCPVLPRLPLRLFAIFLSMFLLAIQIFPLPFTSLTSLHFSFSLPSPPCPVLLHSYILSISLSFYSTSSSLLLPLFFFSLHSYISPLPSLVLCFFVYTLLQFFILSCFLSPLFLQTSSSQPYHFLLLLLALFSLVLPSSAFHPFFSPLPLTASHLARILPRCVRFGVAFSFSGTAYVTAFGSSAVVAMHSSNVCHQTASIQNESPVVYNRTINFLHIVD